MNRVWVLTTAEFDRTEVLGLFVSEERAIQGMQSYDRARRIQKGHDSAPEPTRINETQWGWLRFRIGNPDWYYTIEEMDVL